MVNEPRSNDELSFPNAARRLFRFSQNDQRKTRIAASHKITLVVVKRLSLKLAKDQMIRAILPIEAMSRQVSGSFPSADSRRGCRVHSPRWIAQPSRINAPM